MTYIYIYTYLRSTPQCFAHGLDGPSTVVCLLPAAARCKMVLHQAFRARDVYEKPASAARCDMLLHLVFRARHLSNNV